MSISQTSSRLSKPASDNTENYQVKWHSASDGESDGTSEHEDSLASNSEYSEDESEDQVDHVSSQEDRLPEVLQGWMSNYVVIPIEPTVSVEKEPLYSAKLGIEPRVKRVPSCESIVTQLSLLSCSTYGKRKNADHKKRRRRKTKSGRQINENSSAGSKWIALANRRQGMFDKMLRHQSAHAPLGLQGAGRDPQNNAFELMDDEEKKMLIKCGLKSGLKLAQGLKKSDSTTNIINNIKKEIRRFSQIDLAISSSKLNNPKVLHEKTLDRKKIVQRATGSPANSQASFNKSHHSLASLHANAAPLNSLTMRTVTPPFKEKVRMWQVDELVADVGQQRGMSAAIKKRIASTTMALDRVSRPNTTPGDRRNTPNDKPQSIKISPELCNVIQQDIRYRMGRPRHHALRQRDVENLERGQELDRTHRNLKVFNWLHSLNEEQFENSDGGIDINDEGTYSPSISSQHNFVHVESVDEPCLKREKLLI